MLLVLVCVGFGPAAGIVGISIYSISFFARAFAQCFEEVPEDTIEALRAMGCLLYTSGRPLRVSPLASGGDSALCVARSLLDISKE